MKYLTSKDWFDIAKGATILSTGGGGDMVEAKQIFSSVFGKMEKIPLISLDDLKPDDTLCTAYIAGSVGNYERSTKPLIYAFNILVGVIKKPIKGIVPVEIGPGDIAETVKIASIFNIPVVDADFTGGRSSPEVYLEAITLANLSRTPIVMTNKDGKILILRKKSSALEIEKAVRKFARYSNGSAYVVGYPLSVSKVKNIIDSKTITLCQKIGQSVQTKKFLKTVLNFTKGKILFTGSISNIKTRDNQAFLTGYVYIKGNDQYAGKSAKIFLKNECLLLWVDNKLTLTCPDSICIINKRSRLGIYSRDLKINQDVMILGWPSLNIWKTKKGMNVFAPKTFGFKLSSVLL